MLRRSEKAALIEELHEKLKKAKALVLTDFKGIEVEQMNELRRKLREAEVEYKVFKNTLIRRAAKGTALESLKDEEIVNNNALAISYTDPVVLAKVLTEFKKKVEKFQLKSGILEGKVLHPAEIEALAKLPNKEVLLAQLLGAMNAVPRNFVSLLYRVIANFLNVLEAMKKEKEKQQ